MSRPEVDVAVLTGAIGLATLPMTPVFGAGVLVVPVVAGLVLGAVVALVAARARWGAAVTMAVALTGYLLVGPAVAAPDRTYAGVVPRLDGLAAVLAGAVTSWKQVLTLDPELGSEGNVLVAPFLLVLVATAGGLSLALRASRRAGALAGLVPLVVLVVSVLLGTKVAVAPAPAGIVTVLSVGTWAAWRLGGLAPRRVAALAVVLAVVGGLGSVTGPWLAEQRPRYVLRDEIVPPFDPSDQVSPLSAFRTFVKDWAEDDLLTVRGLPAGGRVRLATMDAFDGVVWDVAGAQAAAGSGTFRRVGTVVDSATRSGTRASVELEVHDLPFVWLPTVGWTTQLAFADAELRDQVRYNEATGTAALVDGVPAGLVWTAEVVVPPVPERTELESAATGTVALPEPRNVPDAVGSYLAETAGQASSPALIAATLEADLQDGYFSHGLTDQGEPRSWAGHGANRVAELLSADPMIGDGEQYASAMALLAREMGLPARVVLGFVPDEPADEVTFTGADIQAWVEVNYTGYGWVAYDPTPDSSRTPEADDSPEDTREEPQVRQPPPPPADPVTPPDDDTEQPRTEDREPQEPTSQVWAVVGRVALAAGLPLLVVAGPPLVIALLKARRRRRRRQSAAVVERVVGGWDELLDHAVDLRRPLPEQATRRELAVALAGSFAAPVQAEGRRAVGIGGPVATLAARADAAVFGGGEVSAEDSEAYWSQVETTVAAMARSVPRRVRWRSRWSTASLRRRPHRA